MSRAHAVDRALEAVRPPDPSDADVREATPRILGRFAERLDGVDDALRAARPADPASPDADEASVRVLARLAMLESGAPAEARSPGRERVRVALRVAAAVLLALAVTQLAGRTSKDVTVAVAVAVPEPASPVCDGLVTCVEQAIAGDALARHQVLAAGGRARSVLLARAEQLDPGAKEALGLLRALGGIRRDDEAEQLREIARRPDVREAAIGLLASAPSAAGARELGVLLGENEDATEDAVLGLLAVAQRGRRASALAALLEGVSAGRVEAAVAALAVARPGSLERLLLALPPALLEHDRLGTAVRAAPVTTRARLVRRASEGDRRALRLATTAGLDGVRPALRAAALGEDREEALWAVGVLARLEDPAAWTTLADARTGAAGEEAAALLARMPSGVLRRLEAQAIREPVSRPAMLAALAAAGADGVTALERLVRRPALRAPVIEALEVATSSTAASLLETLAARGTAGDRALLALGHRLASGDVASGRALVRLAEQGSSRRALRVLERHAAGADAGWLERTRGDTALPRAVRQALERASRRGAPPPRAEGRRTVRHSRSRTKTSPIT